MLLLAEWQSSESHDQWNRIHLETHYQCCSPGISTASSLIQPVYQQPRLNRVYCWWYKLEGSSWYTWRLCCSSAGPWKAGELAGEKLNWSATKASIGFWTWGWIIQPRLRDIYQRAGLLRITRESWWMTRSPRAGNAIAARRANPEVHQEECGQQA